MFLRVVQLSLWLFFVFNVKPARITEVSNCLLLPPITLFAQSHVWLLDRREKTGLLVSTILTFCKDFCQTYGFFCVSCVHEMCLKKRRIISFVLHLRSFKTWLLNVSFLSSILLAARTLNFWALLYRILEIYMGQTHWVSTMVYNLVSGIHTTGFQDNKSSIIRIHITI